MFFDDIKIYVTVMLSAFLAISCTGMTENKVDSEEIIYLETIDINIDDFDQVLYVAKNKNEGDGSKSSPFASVQKAVNNANGGSTAIFLAEGIYAEETIQLRKGISLFGGFDSVEWTRDIIKNQTELTGGNERRVLIAAEGSVIDGLVIRDGLVQGRGGGIFFKDVAPTITNNILLRNKTLGPENWNPEHWHEMANDGGGIYFEGNASPLIENNLFINNETEIGRGAGFACNDQCKPILRENVFLKNFAGLDDPMRSSDGGAVSIFDWGEAVIDSNIFLSNTAGNNNDGGAVFVALWSSADITNNLFVDSKAGDDAGALFIGGQEHRYDEPLDPLPPEEQFFVDIENNTFIANRNASQNSGAMRFTMESRGRFANNITALNNGIYFQRSEVAVEKNIILDNFLFIETKEGLDKGSIMDNIIWADFDLLVEAEVENNNIPNLADISSSNYSKLPRFKDDKISITAFSTNWNRQLQYSKIFDPSQKFKKNELVNRVIKSGDRYSTIISNTQSTIKVWGDFSGKNEFTVLPTYTLTDV